MALDHIGVAVYQHVVVGAVLDIGINRSLLGRVGRVQFDVVSVAIDVESTLKQRFGTIPADIDSCPAGGSPSSLAGAYQGPAAEDFVSMPLKRFVLPVAVSIQVPHGCIIGENVEVWLELQFYPLSIAM